MSTSVYATKNLPLSYFELRKQYCSQKRSSASLNSINCNMIKIKEDQNIKNLSDIDITLACQNYYQENHCEDVKKSLGVTNKSAIINCLPKDICNDEIDYNLLQCTIDGVTSQIEIPNMVFTALMSFGIAASGISASSLVYITAPLILFSASKSAEACNADINFKKMAINIHNLSLLDYEKKIDIEGQNIDILKMPCADLKSFLQNRLDVIVQKRLVASKWSMTPMVPQLPLATRSLLESLHSTRCFNKIEGHKDICKGIASIVKNSIVGGISGKAGSIVANKIKSSESLKLMLSGSVSNAPPVKAMENALTGISEMLNKMKVNFQLVQFLNSHQVIKVVPESTKNIPTWVKMSDALDKKHGIPTYLDPVTPKQNGFVGASVEAPGTGAMILLDPAYVLTNAENVKVLLVHEAIHATGSKKVLIGKALADNNLKIVFKSISSPIHKDLIGSSYVQGFFVDEVKTYSKQTKILKTMLRTNGKNLDPATLNELTNNIGYSLEASKIFSKVSYELLTKSENFLLKNKNLSEIKYTRRPNTDVYDVVVKITNENDAPFIFEIPLHDSGAANSGQIENITQKLLQIITEAKKTIIYYQNGH